MLKDNVRDYATAAFREYARRGCPAVCEKSERGTPDAALVADLQAVSETLRILALEGKEYVAKAVRAVYFEAPRTALKKGDVGKRVMAFAKSVPCSERAVYLWLGEARRVFANVRGLRIKNEKRRV